MSAVRCCWTWFKAVQGTPLLPTCRRLLCPVAARLNILDWSDTLPVADDFMVYPVDLELVDLERNLADCLPPDRLARLGERGLL
ncbi:hypothetical protein ACQRWP_17265 [Micromonospora trifolii]|uniref:hypothetical protein n=1 Tax=Micromonospora trifolii TaxID=2911208 RepID=UPI003D2F4D72